MEMARNEMQFIAELETLKWELRDDAHPLRVIGDVGGGVLVDVLDCGFLPQPVPIVEDASDEAVGDVRDPLAVKLLDVVAEVVLRMELNVAPQE